jgi:hypothetical protein
MVYKLFELCTCITELCSKWLSLEIVLNSKIFCVLIMLDISGLRCPWGCMNSHRKKFFEKGD